MNGEDRDVTAVVAVGETGLVPVPQKPMSYWARASKKYRTALVILSFALAVFLVVFTVLSSYVFSYESLFYFGRDLKTMLTLAELGEHALYYDYQGEEAMPVAYRGGIAVAHRGGVDVYDAVGEQLLSVREGISFASPRLVVSRDYLVAFDFGSNRFVVCNSYDKLYEGTTEAPIYAAFVSDAGYVSLITGSDTYLSEVYLYDAQFNLRLHSKRASATVSAVVSENGRTMAIVGATAEGTLLEVYMIGGDLEDDEPLSSTALSGFPLAVGYTSASKLAVLTDTAAHTLSTDGKVYRTFDYEGGALHAYHIDENGIALALETDRLHGAYRVLVLDKKGRVECDLARGARVRALALSDDRLWLLGENEAVCIDRDGEETLATVTVDDTALDIVALHDKLARVIYVAEARTFAVN
ncbi:MAG: hypothetical protein E7639_04040 [Ruminococcaceae bacterium]|nr:hypothetical protein [Oscillospiraceae bacterium]